MYSKQVLVQNPSGLHARPASELTRLAQQFTCQLRILHQGTTVEPRSIINILCAGIGPGSTLTVQGDGADEQQAVDAIVDFIENLGDE